jgi:hypothetical protein
VKLYIAGPMTGYPDFNYPAFFAAACELAVAGYEVINPANLGIRDDIPYEQYIRRGVEQVLQAEGIATLDGWELSKGAKLEVGVGSAIGIWAKPVSAWVEEVA